MNYDPRNIVVYSRHKVVNGLHIRLQVTRRPNASTPYVGYFYLNDQLLGGSHASSFFYCYLALLQTFFELIRFEVGAYEEFFND